MANETKKSVLEEASDDMKNILEAADKNAMKKLAKELPDKFDALLKEEIEKLSNNKKEPQDKEPAKEGKINESVNDKKDGKVNESVDLTKTSLGEVENAYDNANPNDEFNVEPKKDGNEVDITMEDIEKELAEMQGMANEMGEAANNAEDKGLPFSTKLKNIYNQIGEMVQEMDEKKMHEEYGAQFNESMSGIYGETFRDKLGEDKVNELYEMFVAHKKGDPFKEEGTVNEGEAKLKVDPFKEKSNPSKEQGKSIDENEVSELHDKGPDPAVIDKMHKGDLSPQTIKEKKEEDVDKKDDSKESKEEKREEDKDVDESHGSSLAQNKKTGAEDLPRKEYGAQYKENKYRYAKRNEDYQKRITSLLEDNKKTTKELNEYKKGYNKIEKLVENYKGVLQKYRNQLSEMAVFNTNLANVNNLLVNEQLTLTSEDKVKIIDKFKKVNSIEESEKVYTNVLSEMTKSEKKTITESVEDKLNKTIDSSAKLLVDEAVEKTAYKNTHVEKIKNLMKYVDDFGKRK